VIGGLVVAVARGTAGIEIDVRDLQPATRARVTSVRYSARDGASRRSKRWRASSGSGLYGSRLNGPTFGTSFTKNATELREVPRLAVGLPELLLEVVAREVVDEGGGRHRRVELLDVRAVELPGEPRRLVDDGAEGPAVRRDRDVLVREHVVEAEPVRLLERAVEDGVATSNAIACLKRSRLSGTVRDLEDVEAELGLEVRGVVLGVGHDVAVLLPQLRIDLGHRAVRRLGVADAVRYVGERARRARTRTRRRSARTATIASTKAPDRT
jgi:hypothetical protein